MPIFAEKSVLTTCGLWGIVYAGCYYTFLDIKQPIERLDIIINRLSPNIIFTDKSNYTEIYKLYKNIEIVCIEDILEYPSNEILLEDIKEKMCGINPLYVNFTSGTTGEPKGVIVSHISVIDFIDIFIDTFDITYEEKIGNQAPFDFDVSVKDIYSSAATGATLVIIPREFFSRPMKLIDYLCKEQVTTLIWAVSAMCFLTTMKAFEYKVPKTIRKIMFSGEIIPNKHLKLWKKFLPNAMYVNLYGPTEITCNCTYYILDPKKSYEEGIPIGKPFKNEKVFLLDENRQLISEADIEGEICVAGVCVAIGYYGNQRDSKYPFIQNPLNMKYEEKIYLTGDLAQYKEDGQLYYIGRKDAQIKYLGHRIELSEIEFYVNQLEKVNRACCVFYHEKQRLVLFYLGSEEEEVIINYLSKKLPVYMIPNICIQVDSIPLTKNGKLDRSKLLNEYLQQV